MVKANAFYRVIQLCMVLVSTSKWVNETRVNEKCHKKQTDAETDLSLDDNVFQYRNSYLACYYFLSYGFAVHPLLSTLSIFLKFAYLFYKYVLGLMFLTLNSAKITHCKWWQKRLQWVITFSAEVVAQSPAIIKDRQTQICFLKK